jgi:CRISPR system Cascade subunit CasA
MNETDLANLPPDDPIDILERPIFTVVPDDGPRLVLSLAGLFSRLGHGEPTELAYLMPHQQHVMHAFCVQLAALVCARSGDAKLDRSEAEWREALRALAGSKEAFQLVVGDLSKPAFMQPPVPAGNLDDFGIVPTPDELDVLVLAKNHDVKAARIHRPRVEHWLFALISLQTQQGFSGRDNYGVARMNGGFGNRPGIGVSRGIEWHRRLARDVRVATDALPKLLAEGQRYRDDGLATLWTVPWDGTKSLGLGELHPLFIEICRRVRLTRARGVIVARTRSTKVPRLEAKEAKGNTGDLWTPVDVERGAALTLPAAGFPYARVSQLLFEDDWIRPASLELRDEDGDRPVVVARALVRGQGKTEGLHERVVTLPPRARGLLRTRDGRGRLGALSKERIEAVRNLRLRVLKPALCAFLQGGLDDLKLDDDRADDWLDRLERDVDAEFFPRLFADIETDADERSKSFETWLDTLGRDLLERAMASLPTPSARRERDVAAAEARFFGGVRKNFQRVELRRPQTTSSQENDSP